MSSAKIKLNFFSSGPSSTLAGASGQNLWLTAWNLREPWGRSSLTFPRSVLTREMGPAPERRVGREGAEREGETSEKAVCVIRLGGTENSETCQDSSLFPFGNTVETLVLHPHPLAPSLNLFFFMSTDTLDCHWVIKWKWQDRINLVASSYLRIGKLKQRARSGKVHYTSRDLKESWEERGRVAGADERVWRPGTKGFPLGSDTDGPEAMLWTSMCLWI